MLDVYADLSAHRAAPAEGDGWKTNLTTVFAGTSAYVVYDLGEERRVEALLVQGRSRGGDSVLDRTGAGTAAPAPVQTPPAGGAVPKADIQVTPETPAPENTTPESTTPEQTPKQ